MQIEVTVPNTALFFPFQLLALATFYSICMSMPTPANTHLYWYTP
jgi:hypothetical protein